MSHSKEISGALRPMKEECEQLVRHISFMVWTYKGRLRSGRQRSGTLDMQNRKDDDASELERIAATTTEESQASQKEINNI